METEPFFSRKKDFRAHFLDFERREEKGDAEAQVQVLGKYFFALAHAHTARAHTQRRRVKEERNKTDE